MLVGLGRIGVALALIGAPSSDVPPPSAATQDASPELERARKLYNDGRARFEMAEYKLAIELWTEAFMALPDTAENGRTKALLIYNIATARERAYDVDKDPTHLRRAKILMTQYRDAIPALYGDGPDATAEMVRIGERLDEVQRLIEQHDADQDAQKAAQGMRTAAPPRDPGPPGPKPKVLVATGASLIGLGGAGLAVMTAGLVMGERANDLDDVAPTDISERRDQFRRGRTGNVMAIAGGVIGGAALAAGIPLVIIGKRRGRKASVSAWLGRTRAGIMIRGRF